MKNILNELMNTSGCDNLYMYVEKSCGKNGDKKCNYCYFCQTKQRKIARHLQNRHKDIEVRKFFHCIGSVE